MTRLAILGGAFDPIHRGHLHLAQSAARDFACPVRLIPNAHPPHRPPPVADWRHRLAMCALATADHPDITVGEEEPPGLPRYTANTLEHLRGRHPTTTFLLIIGTDAYATFHRWRHPHKILATAHLLLVPRPAPPPPQLHYPPPLPTRATLNTGAGGVQLWPCHPPPISATQCRRAIAANAPTDRIIPPTVAAYIHRHHLYRPLSQASSDSK